MVEYQRTKRRDRRLNAVYHALSDPTRRAIVTTLADGRRTPVTVIAEGFPLSLSNVSKHIHVLEESGLLRREREGRTHYCSLDVAVLDESAAWIESIRLFWESRLDALAAMFARRKSSEAHP